MGRCLSPNDTGLQLSGSPLDASLHPLGSGQDPGSWGGGGGQAAGSLGRASVSPSAKWGGGMHGPWWGGHVENVGQGMGRRQAHRSAPRGEACSSWLSLQASVPDPEHRQSPGFCPVHSGERGGSQGSK